MLPAILKSYHLLCLKAENGAQALYRCAREPDPSDLARVGEASKRRHGLSKLELRWSRPRAAGGFVLQLQGITYDKSVRGMLRAACAASSKEGNKHDERQTGRDCIHFAEEISHYEEKTQISETGSVVQIGDGIATVYGLENVMYGELLEFENGVKALAMNLETGSVGCAILGPEEGIEEGDQVRRTGRRADVPW